MKKRVVVVDYGIGNVLSVMRAFEHCGAEVVLSNDLHVIEKAEYLVLPGVGAFADGIQELQRRELVYGIKEFCLTERPFLGICLGMQMMMELSEEFGVHEGLGICRGRVVKVPDNDIYGAKLKVPSIGWYALKSSEQAKWENTLLADFIEKEPEVYVVHSYMAKPADDLERVAFYNYGGHEITAMIAKDNKFGCQFHPEKSGETGLKMLRRFIEL